VNGKDARHQNTDFRIQSALVRHILNSEICILTSDIFAVSTSAKAHA
jgi:hypothetical protein